MYYNILEPNERHKIKKVKKQMNRLRSKRVASRTQTENLLSASFSMIFEMIEEGFNFPSSHHRASVRAPRRVFPCERARSWNCWALDSSTLPIFHQQAVSSARAATLRHQMNLAKGTMWTFLLFDAKTCLNGATAVHINSRCFTRHWHFLSRQLALNVGKSPISFMTV